MPNHVSLAFAALPDAALADFSVGVHDGMAANTATFATPPVTMTALATANGSFSSALAAANKGSVAQTAAKDASHNVLLGLLRQLATYVEGVAQGDAAKIRLAGFEVTTHAHSSQTPLDKPAITAVLNNVTTQLLLRVTPVTNAHAYEVQFKSGTGDWQPGGSFGSSRSVILQGLTPGTSYTLRVRGIGGSTGHSDWSDPVIHMAT